MIVNQRLVPWIYAGCLFVAFPWALDKSTFPKTFVLVFVTILLLIKSQLLRYSKSLIILLAIWCMSLLVFLVIFDFENLNSILLGYPQRNNGLLSILLFLIVYFYFRSIDSIFRAKTLMFSSFLISISIWTSYVSVDVPLESGKTVKQQGSFFLSQFTWPLPDAINRNIVSLFLCLGLVSTIQILFSKNSNLPSFLSHIFMCFTNVSAVIRLGDLQSLVYLGVLGILYTIVFNKYLTRRVIYLLSLTIAQLPILNLLILSSSKLTGNSSLDERLTINRMALIIAKETPFALRAPDTTADTRLSTLLGESIDGGLIDNAHSVWLELAIHLGWVPALILMLLFMCILFLTQIGIAVNLQTGKISKGVAAGKFSILIIIFISSFITILHPITVFAVAVSASSLFIDFHETFLRFKNNSVIFDSSQMLKKSAKFAGARKKVFQIWSKYLITAWLILMVPLLSLVLMLKQQIEFHVLESKLLTNSVSFEISVIKLTDLVMEMNERQYLEYAGRQLTSLNNCPQLFRVLSEQSKLGFSDKRVQNLRDWYNLNCRN